MAERQHRSVSQVNQFTRCAYSWYLSRVVKAWQRPAAWLAQGSAVHEAAEFWEKGNRTATVEETQDVFRESYAKHIAESTEHTPNFSYWFRSGPYDGEADVERRFGIGLEQTERFIRYHLAHPDDVIWIAPDGTPGIEIGFDFELEEVPVRGFIDAVRIIDGRPVVVDYKTGNTPGDDFQLGVYSVALAEQFGAEKPTQGVYWMARTGKPTYPYDLREWTTERVAEKFHELEAAIAADKFDPDPEPRKCQFCDVALACEYSAA